jgi:hypothetical protein
MAQQSEPFEDRSVGPRVEQTHAPYQDRPEDIHRARVSAARALVTVRRRTGRPIPDEVLALAAEEV